MFMWHLNLRCLHQYTVVTTVCGSVESRHILRYYLRPDWCLATQVPHTTPDIFLWLSQNEVDRACSMCGGEERCIQGFGGEI